MLKRPCQPGIQPSVAPAPRRPALCRFRAGAAQTWKGQHPAATESCSGTKGPAPTSCSTTDTYCGLTAMKMTSADLTTCRDEVKSRGAADSAG